MNVINGISIKVIIAIILFSMMFSIGKTADQHHGNGKSLLNPIRNALGFKHFDDIGAGIQIDGVGEYKGMPCNFNYIFLSNGEWRKDIHCPLGNIIGFDGYKGWKIDDTGMPQEMELQSINLSNIVAWLIGGYWLNPACPIEIDKVNCTDKGIDNDHYLLKLINGKKQAILKVRRKNDLPDQLYWFDDDNAINKWYFSDYFSFQGFYVPTVMHFECGSQKLHYQVTNVTSIRENSLQDCKQIKTLPKDTFYFNKSNDSVDDYVPIKWVATGNFLVKPSVNEEDVGWFLVDTAAARNAIDSLEANKLGFERIGSTSVSGTGGIIDTRFYRSNQLSLGLVMVKNPLFIGINLKEVEPYTGCKLGGILGYDFIARTLIELDLKKNELRLYKPGYWNNKKDNWVNFEFIGNIPHFECEIEDGKKGLFYLDTGSAFGIALKSDFIERNSLMKNRELKARGRLGIGGASTSYEGSLKWFRLGHLLLKNPQTIFNKSGSEESSNQNIAGSIGCAVLKNITIRIDYPKRRIQFIRSK